MNSGFLFFLFASTALIIFSLGTLNGYYSYRVAPRLDINPVEPGHHSDLGVVGGVRSCGGPGRVVEWRYEPCSGESPCRVPGDGERKRSELEFIPSEDISTLGLRINVITENGAHKVYERATANSEVQGGQIYIANGSGGPPKEMIGRSYTLQYILYRVDDDNVEICAEADFIVVEP